MRNSARISLLCHKRNQLPIDVRIGLLVGMSGTVRDQDSGASDLMFTLRGAVRLTLREILREIAV